MEEGNKSQGWFSLWSASSLSRVLGEGQPPALAGMEKAGTHSLHCAQGLSLHLFCFLAEDSGRGLGSSNWVSWSNVLLWSSNCYNLFPLLSVFFGEGNFANANFLIRYGIFTTWPDMLYAYLLPTSPERVHIPNSRDFVLFTSGSSNAMINVCHREDALHVCGVNKCEYIPFSEAWLVQFLSIDTLYPKEIIRKFELVIKGFSGYHRWMMTNSS